MTVQVGVVGTADQARARAGERPGARGVLRLVLTGAMITAATALPITSTSAEVLTASRVSPASTWHTTTVAAGSTYRVTGTASPARTTRAVTLQRYASGRWSAIVTARTSAGRFTVQLPTRTPGSALYRLYLAPINGAKAALSTTIRFTVSAPVPAQGLRGNPASYRFLLPMSGGGAARWDPCTPITYRVNTTHATAGALADVQGALARISAVTGLRFVYKGATTAIPRNNYDGQPADADILIAWAAPGSSDMLPKVPAGQFGIAGLGGAWATTGGWTAQGRQQDRMVQGHVILDDSRVFAPGFGTGPTTGWQGTRGQLLMHELGHVIGLGHVSGDSWEIMNPAMSRMPAVYGAGDVAGLRQLGSAAGCIYDFNPRS